MFGSSRSLVGNLQTLKTRIRNPVWMGNLRHKVPVSRWGWERGTPIDRYYIEHFLEDHSLDIRGDVLEVFDRAYTDRFGSGVTSASVLDLSSDNRRATIVADLTKADIIPTSSFDCFILTQTLQYIPDSRAALRHAARILKPGGTLLATVPVVSRVDNEFDYWRFTQHACARLFGEAFGPHNVTIQTRGNCVAAIAVCAGLAAQELRAAELNRNDPGYPILACIRATKSESGDIALPT